MNNYLNIEFAALLTSLLINLVQIFAWVNAAQRKRFAAEQDFIDINRKLASILSKLDKLIVGVDKNSEGYYRDIKEMELQILCEMNELKAFVIKLLGGSK